MNLVYKSKLKESMALSGDEMSEALSAAVGAHLIQEGDLREEIAGKPANQLINEAEFQGRPYFNENIQHFGYHMRRNTTSPTKSPMYTDNDYSYSRPPSYDLANVLPSRDLARPPPDRRFVVSHKPPSPTPYPPPPQQPRYLPTRQVEQYDSTDGVRLSQFPGRPAHVKRSRSPPSTFMPSKEWRTFENARPIEDRPRMEELVMRESMISHKNQVSERLPFPTHHDRSVQHQSNAIHRPPSDLHRPPPGYLQRGRMRPPLRSNVRSRSSIKHSRKRFLKNTRSRVYTEEEGKEESFDDMLSDHRRHQEGNAGFVGAAFDSSNSNTDRYEANKGTSVGSRLQPLPAEGSLPLSLPQKSHADLSDTTRSQNASPTIEIENKLYPIKEIQQAILLNPLLNQLGVIKPAANASAGTVKLFASAAAAIQGTQSCKEKLLNDEQRNDLKHIQRGHDEGNIVEQDPQEDQTFANDFGSLQRPFLQSSNEEEIDDDDDEELLKLRSAALLSAYNRNVDIDKEDNCLEDDFPQETKANEKVKKKTKQSKEVCVSTLQKKHSKKDGSSSSGRSSASRSAPKERIASPSSPPIDPYDPSILTLGGVLKREKAKREKALLHDIRNMNDPDAGVKRFMDLIKTKNERDEKTKKKSKEMQSSPSSAKLNGSADNYDEVEMEVEDTDAQADIAVKESPSYDIDSLASDEEDPEPLCPPGTEDEHVSASPDCTPTQENIWELLDEPLTNEVPLSPQQQLTAADKLIMSIRASSGFISTTQEVVKSSPEPDIKDSAELNACASQKNTKNSENADYPSVDSPYEFEHAFETRYSSDPYPAIATDLNCKVQDDLTSTALDGDAAMLDSAFSAKQVLLTSENALSAASPLSPSRNSPKTERDREARHSLEDEDEDELRQKLLRDLAQKRAAVKPALSKEAPPMKEKKKKKVSATQSKIELPPIKLSKKAGRKFAYKFRMAKGNPKLLQLVRRKVKKALKYKRKRIRRKINDQLKKARQATAIAAVIAAGSDYDPFAQFTNSLSSNSEENPSAKKAFRRLAVKKKTNPFKIINISRPAAFPPRSQLTKVNTHPKRSPSAPQSLASTSAAAQCTVPAPFVVKHQLSSDEDDRRVVFSSHLMKEDPQRDVVVTQDSDTSIAEDATEILSPAKDNATPLSATEDLSRKRKLETESSEDAKLFRTDNHPKQQPQSIGPSHNVADATSVRAVKISMPSFADQRNVIFNTSETPKIDDSVKQKVNSELVEFEDKLIKLRELLGRDKATVSRMRQQSVDFQNEMLQLRRVAEDLEKKLKENEIEMTKIAGSLEKHEANEKKVVLTMEKRQKLQAKFLKKIEELKAKQMKLTVPTLPPVSNTETSQITNSLDSAMPICDREVENKAEACNTFGTEEAGPSLEEEGVAELTAERVRKQREREREKSLLLERSKALELEKEKALLRQAEMKLKLKLYKRSTDQAGKRMGASSPRKNALLSKLNGRDDVRAPLASARKRQKQLQAPVQSDRSALNNRQQLVISISTNQATPKEVKVDKPSTKASSQVTVVEPAFEAGTTKEKLIPSYETYSATNQIQGDANMEGTPVTPTLKKKRGDRRSSSSSVTTPTGTSDWNHVTSMEIKQDEPKLPSLTAKECNGLKRRLQHKLTSKAASSSLDDNLQSSSLVRLFHVPTCFKNWVVDVGEIAGKANNKKESRRALSLGSQYQSPLKNFRSYRLSSSFSSRQRSLISSPTFSHKIHADQILCRYDLNGKCQDSKCRAQHFKDIQLTPSEIYLDLLWYCPTLLKTMDGRQVTASDSLDLQLKAADETVARLCNTSSKTANAKRTVEETCALLVNIINRALGNKEPHTTVLSRRRVRMQPTFDEEDDAEIPDASSAPEESPSFPDTMNMEEVGANTSDVRYYVEDDKHRTMIERLSSLVEQHPEDELMRIRLANAFLEHPKEDPSVHDRSVELALHTLCDGIESNERSERLWSAYVPLLRQHHGGETSNRNNELEIIDQILVLLPLSKAVWDEIFKWRWSFEKLDAYYHHLIENLVARNTIWESEDNSELASHKHSFAYYSSWLLQATVERCQLLRLCGRRTEAKHFMATTLKAMSDTHKRHREGEESDFYLTPEDTVKLWLTYIHFIEFGKLPCSLFDDSLSSHMFGMVEGFGDVIIPFTSSRKLVQKPEKLRALFKEACRCSSNVSEDASVNATCKFHLYRSLVKLEASLENWDGVSNTCQELLKDLSNQNNISIQSSDVWVMWIEAILQSSDPVLITQMFDKAITACPRSAKLAYMSAIYQLNSDHRDIEAALLYLEWCIRSLIDMEEDEGLSTLEIHQCYRRLLKHDVTLHSSSNVQLREDVTPSIVEKEKTYLWLIYCLLMDLVISQEDEAIYDAESVNELYEAALLVASSTEDLKTIWIQYLVYVRSTAINLEEGTTSSDRAAVVEAQRDRLDWLKRFTALVRRCLTAVPARSNVNFAGMEKSHTDYAFHNEVCAIFFSCFKKSQLPVAMTILTDAMPTNLPLLSKTAFHLLRYEDYVSVTSLLWRVTSSYSSSNGSCKNYKLWKAAATALIAEGKHLKAIRLYHRALSVLPQCKALWLDVAALTLAYGDPGDLEKVNVECKKFLGEYVGSLLRDSLGTSKS